MKLLSIAVLKRTLQNRIEMDPVYIAELREIWRESEETKVACPLPPVTVFADGKGKFWLADGYHRCRAAELEGIEKITCNEYFGDERTAMLHAIGANQRHGLRRTHGDKRKAVLALLNDPEWATWSHRKVAEHTGVTREYVSKVVRQLSGQPVAGEEGYATFPETVPSQAESPAMALTSPEEKTNAIADPPTPPVKKAIKRMLLGLRALFDSLSEEDQVETRMAIMAMFLPGHATTD